MRASEAQLQQLDLQSVLSHLLPVNDRLDLYLAAAQQNVTCVFHFIYNIRQYSVRLDFGAL